MSKAKAVKVKSTDDGIVPASEKTKRVERFWINGKAQELAVYRVPISQLYFNIENGRYADRMIQLKADNPGVEIDPRKKQWKDDIARMLRGEYPNTERDKEPFTKLVEDLKARTQLRPGVVLRDGAVLDGNRRLAALQYLHDHERNVGQFDHMDAVILGKEVSAADRWRIEAGIQLSRDERHDYAPINQLLKIKEGFQLFRGSSNPAKDISDTLYDVSESEVKRDLEKITYIDMYLTAIGKPDAYNLVSGLTERLEEVTTILNDAKKLDYGPQEIKNLRNTLWALVKYQAMDNWQLRYVKQAIGASGKGRSKNLKNPEALAELVNLGFEDQEIKNALKNESLRSKVRDRVTQNAEGFIATMQAAEMANEPLRLAKTAAINLSAVLKTLKSRNSMDSSQRKELKQKLEEIRKIAQDALKHCGK